MLDCKEVTRIAEREMKLMRPSLEPELPPVKIVKRKKKSKAPKRRNCKNLTAPPIAEQDLEHTSSSRMEGISEILAQQSFPSEPQSASIKFQTPTKRSVKPSRTELAVTERFSRLRPVLIDDASYRERHPEFKFTDASVQADLNSRQLGTDWAMTPIYTHVDETKRIARFLPVSELGSIARDLTGRPKDFDLSIGRPADVLSFVLDFCKHNALTETEVQYLQSTVASLDSRSKVTDVYKAAKRTFFVLMCRLGQVSTFRSITDRYDC